MMEKIWSSMDSDIKAAYSYVGHQHDDSNHYDPPNYAFSSYYSYLQHRILAASSSSSSYKIDYNVLSVAAMTLALIMMVEYLRHRLDHWAYHSATTETPTQSKQPLYRAVLEGVYAELATLGIVEFVLHLIEEYYPSYDKARKSVFADVHFLLFYTAIINALFSIITATIVTRISKQQWIQTELLELYHYNEIQQTFLQVQKELNALHSAKSPASSLISNDAPPSSSSPPPTTSTTSDPEVGTTATSKNCNIEVTNSTIWDDPWTYGQMNVRNVYTSIMDYIRYPHLKYQYDILLSQIRFHDLRSHIIDSYQLPKPLKISNYLMRCSEQTVLMKLVNVSSLAWLLLTGAVCILYFVLGIVFYKFEDQTLIGTSLSFIYIAWMLSFIMLCFILSNKTKSIFFTLLHSTDLWDVATNSVQEKERLAKKQLALFWYSEPTIIIKLIQFMQFGFAASLSTILVFWTDIDNGMIPMYGYIVTLLFSYGLFIHVTGRAIPQYTLCTSLGQLVNDRYLRESVAVYRLKEAKQKEMVQSYDNINGSTLPSRTSGSGKSNPLNNSIVVVNPDKLRNNLTYEAELLSNRSLKSVNETIPEENEETCDETIIEHDKQVPFSLNGGNENIRLPESSVTDMLPESSVTDTLVRPLNAVPPNNDGSAPISQFHTDVEAIDKNKCDCHSANLDDSSSHQSITFENLARNRNVDSFTDKNRRDDDYKDDDDDNDELFVSYADNVQTSFESPCIVAIEPSSHATKHVSFVRNICDRVHSYYTSERHIEISNVYGAIVAFFLVGQRVEGFIHSQEIVSSAFLSFHYRLEIVFWMLTAWLCMFIGASVLIIVLLLYYDDFQSMKGYKLGAAALIDFIISSVCLIVLLIAEVKRCCESEPNLSSLEKLVRSNLDEIGPTPCSCSSFGTRTYGGLGTIEPYASLVFLRIIRHWVARKMMTAIQQKYKWPNVKHSDDGDEHGKLHLAKSTHQIMKAGGHTMSHLNNMAVVTEIWEATIRANPDIVAKHGEFSGEILRAMLGLSATVTPNGVVSDKSLKSSLQVDEPPTSGNQLFALQKQYSDLTPEAQEIILSGKMGRRMIRSTSCKLENSQLPASRNSLSRNHSVMFEIDNCDLSLGDDPYCNFVSPNARLLHSMRRCDRKFLPLFDKWITVDVVMTPFEVVYLEVDIDDNKKDSSPSSECVHEALQATKGGKGLRLCDVVAGRRVTGRVGFADIQAVHVERHLPYDDEEIETSVLSDCPAVEVESMEYWRVSSSRPSLPNAFSKTTRTQQWCHVKEDHLRIETAGGALMLRFFADLEVAKHHPEHLSAEFEETGKLFQNNALRWAKSIANLCGPEQLTKQDMSHNGENSSEELRDYLVLIDREKKRHSHRRVFSDGFDNMLPTMLSIRGFSRRNLMQQMTSVRTMSTPTTGDRNLRRNVDVGFDTSSCNMNGEPSSGTLPAAAEDKGDHAISTGKKVSFSHPAL